MASRILGMGDVMTLIEKAQENIDIDPEQAGDLAKRMKNADFTLDDFLSQMQQIKKMGPLSGILKMLPGHERHRRYRHPGRRDEEAGGHYPLHDAQGAQISRNPQRQPPPPHCGRAAERRCQDVNQLIRQFEDMKKQMKMVMNQARGKKGRFRFPPMR